MSLIYANGRPIVSGLACQSKIYPIPRLSWKRDPKKGARRKEFTSPQPLTASGCRGASGSASDRPTGSSNVLAGPAAINDPTRCYLPHCAILSSSLLCKKEEEEKKKQNSHSHTHTHTRKQPSASGALERWTSSPTTHRRHHPTKSSTRTRNRNDDRERRRTHARGSDRRKRKERS